MIKADSFSRPGEHSDGLVVVMQISYFSCVDLSILFHRTKVIHFYNMKSITNDKPLFIVMYLSGSLWMV